MAESDPAPSPLSSKKENQLPISSKIADLNESRSELLTRIQGLKRDLQNWRSKLDTQVKIYRDDLTELKKTLNVEVEQLRSEFQDLRTTLQQQQEDVATSLRNLGMQDASDTKESLNPVAEENANDVQVPIPKENVTTHVCVCAGKLKTPLLLQQRRLEMPIFQMIEINISGHE